jgi:preprotein translocase subunit SecG
LALIGIVLIQKSEGGALGIGGGGGSGGGMGGFMTGRETANLLTRSTAVLATLFMGLSLAIAIISNQGDSKGSILDSAPTTLESTPSPEAVITPEAPKAPSAPVAQ